MARPLAAGALALCLAACAAPLEGGRACPEAACPEGRLCVVGRCRAPEGGPSPGDATRFVLTPADAAVVSLHGSGGRETLPEHVAIGRDASGTVVILLRFAATWRDDAEIASAFLVLEPAAGAPPAARPVRFEMARIAEAWEPSVVSWGRQPRLGVPQAAGSVRARPAVPVRIDVTPLVREWGKRAGDDHGIALLARGDDELGAVISMGVSQGQGPRLEVYVK